jgi:TetR/AcrR family transcriptional regulator, cholesterol catabolism regulator
MHREEKSERSRRVLLDAALRLFSRRGYRATTVRDIAEGAGVSTGNLYHHFADKEAIFQTLLNEYREITMSSRFPIMRALTTGVFPQNLEELAYATRDSVRQFRSYMALHYVDVIEFEGTHIRTFYSDLAQRFADAVRERQSNLDPKLRPGVSPTSALLVATRLFISYFQLEILLGVPEPFGKDSAQVVHEIADMLRNGMTSPES